MASKRNQPKQHLEELNKRLEASGKTTRKTPKDMPKMSEVFIEFMEPFRFLLENSEERDFIVLVGVVAWNMGLAPKKHHKKMIHSFTDSFAEMEEDVDPELTKEVRSVLTELIHRKVKEFSDDPRKIIDYQIKPGNDEFRIAIAFEL